MHVFFLFSGSCSHSRWSWRWLKGHYCNILFLRWHRRLHLTCTDEEADASRSDRFLGGLGVIAAFRMISDTSISLWPNRSFFFICLIPWECQLSGSKIIYESGTTAKNELRWEEEEERKTKMSLLQKSLIHAHFFLFKLTLKCKNTDFPFRALFAVINDFTESCNRWLGLLRASSSEGKYPTY